MHLLTEVHLNRIVAVEVALDVFPLTISILSVFIIDLLVNILLLDCLGGAHMVGGLAIIESKLRETLPRV